MKLALIGGGSVRTYFFVQSLLKYCKKLGITELSVMDIDAKKLEYFGGFALHLVKNAKAPLKAELTTDLAAAVKDADFVVTTIRVGGDEARCRDERIALKYGVIGQETTGAGGFSYASRSIPAMLEICEAVRRHSKPGVTVFNFTNPSGLVTQAMLDTGYEVIGICDNATGIKMDLSKALRVNSGEMFVRVYGLNHLSWADEVVLGGKNILPQLMKSDDFVEEFHQFAYFDRDLIRLLGKIPNGYLYYFYHREQALQNICVAAETRGEAILRINREMMAEFDKMNIKTQIQEMIGVFHRFMDIREKSYMKTELGGKLKNAKEIDIEALGIPQLNRGEEVPEIYEGYAGVAFNYIESKLLDKPIDLALNVANNGAINGFDNNDVVEVTCMVDKNGAKPVKIGDIPPDELNLARLVKRYERLTVAAVRERSIELAAEAMMQHPLVSSYSLAKRLAAEYAKANEPFTGRWN